MSSSLVVSTRGRPVPYITLNELQRAPIYGQLTALLPGASAADRDAELRRIIMRASSMINGEVNQNLAATLDNEIGEVLVSPTGDLRIHTRSNPIVKVLQLELGPDPSRLTDVANLDSLVLDPWRITLPAAASAGSNLPVSLRPGQRMWARWQYINGFPVTTLAEPATAGDTTVTVVEPLGIIPEQTLLTFNDGRLHEQTVVTEVDGDVLTLADPLFYDHAVGTGVSDIPDVIKEATLLLISRLHDTWSLSMNVVSMDGHGAKKPKPATTGFGGRALCDAGVMLAPYRRVW